ncbi:MAG: DUF3149 domain-containing protein [bacterium]
MDLWLDLLFGNAVGASSVAVVVFIIGMAIYLARMFINNAKNDK